ncbi:MAG: transcriptional regulator [Legionellales bacterium]|nr:transcriptional regulator [Legionellales bacterium]|tara:strand:- start:13682 stop:13939 length:258 start_codon:yes stop_codon:yes gene_type:complete
MLIHSPEELAMFVREQRKRAKLTQATASHTVGLKQSTVSAFETNPDGTKVETLFRILSAIGIELHLVVRGDKTIPSATSTWDEEW